MPEYSALDFAALQRALPDRVSRAGDARYAEAVSIWNGSITKRPAAVAHCRDAQEVGRAIAFAREQQIELSVRGGGHNLAGHALCAGGLMIDLSLQRDVSVDPVQRRARCGGGTRWAELDSACQEHGLAVTGGMISHTGVAGLTLGGGIGWLHNKAGLSCDNLVSVEIVVADGSVLRASHAENAELFWAVRGGGGNFGVVTEFEFQLTQVGPLVQLGMFFYGLDHARAMLRFANEFTRTLDEDTGIFICAMNAPPAPFVPTEQQGKPCYALLVAGLGDPNLHARQVESIRAAVPPGFELVTPIPYVELQKMFDASAPWGTHAYQKAVYLKELNDAAIAVIASQFPSKPTPQSLVPIFPLAGRYARAAEDSVAFGGKRDTRFIVEIAAITDDAMLLESATVWVRRFWSELVPHAEGVGCYVNYQIERDDERVRASYGAAKYARLSAIKAKYDPENLFHLNTNIKPRAL